MLSHRQTLPVTAAPSPNTFAEVYDRLAEETNEILVVTHTGKLGITYRNAVQGIELMKRKCRVEAVDSKLATMALGLIVIAAAKVANAGARIGGLVNMTRDNIDRANFVIAFDTLEYLKRGGRIGRAKALLGSVLNVNPIITMAEGEIQPVGRVRSRARAIDYLYNYVMSYTNIEEMAVEYATALDEAEMLIERLDSKFPKERIYRSQTSPVIGTHTGPGLIAVSVLGDRQ